MSKGKGNNSTRVMVARLEERFDNYILGPTGLIIRFEDLEKAVKATNLLLEGKIQPLLSLSLATDHPRIMKDLYGDPASNDADERKGELVRFDDHVSSHKKINAAMIAMLGTMATAIASMWRDILKGLGFLK